MKRRIVFIAEYKLNNDNISIKSNNLEFLTYDYYQSILRALNDNHYDYLIYNNIEDFLINISYHKKDLVFSLWSGTVLRGRKAYIPAICEAYNIQYIGSSAYTNFLCADKYLTKKYCEDFGMISAKSVLINKLDQIDLLDSLQYPLIVKPNFEGGSIGISEKSFVSNKQEAIEILTELKRTFDDKILVEEFLPGKEITVVVINRQNKICILGENLIMLDGKEMINNDIFSLEKKKQDINRCSKKVVSLLSKEDKEIIKSICSSFDKADYIRVDGKVYNGKFHLIELTPDASLSLHSSMYNIFQSKGYTHAGMINYLINLSIENSSNSKCQ